VLFTRNTISNADVDASQSSRGSILEADGEHSRQWDLGAEPMVRGERPKPMRLRAFNGQIFNGKDKIFPFMSTGRLFFDAVPYAH